QPVHEFSILLGQVVEEAVDRLDDDTPLRETGDGAQRVEARLELVRAANAELWVILDLLTLFGACGRASYATTFNTSIVGHDKWRWRSPAKIPCLRRASAPALACA